MVTPVRCQRRLSDSDSLFSDISMIFKSDNLLGASSLIVGPRVVSISKLTARTINKHVAVFTFNLLDPSLMLAPIYTVKQSV